MLLRRPPVSATPAPYCDHVDGNLGILRRDHARRTGKDQRRKENSFYHAPSPGARHPIAKNSLSRKSTHRAITVALTNSSNAATRRCPKPPRLHRFGQCVISTASPRIRPQRDG